MFESQNDKEWPQATIKTKKILKQLLKLENPDLEFK